MRTWYEEDEGVLLEGWEMKGMNGAWGLLDYGFLSGPLQGCMRAIRVSGVELLDASGRREILLRRLASSNVEALVAQSCQIGVEHEAETFVPGSQIDTSPQHPLHLAHCAETPCDAIRESH